MGYIDKEALLSLFSKFTESAWFKENHPWALHGFKVAAEEVENFPESDVIEKVCCKDCKYWDLEKNYCCRFGPDGEWEENDYCSRFKKNKKTPYVSLDSVVNTVCNVTEQCDLSDIIDLRDLIIHYVKGLAAIDI